MNSFSGLVKEVKYDSQDTNDKDSAIQLTRPQTRHDENIKIFFAPYYSKQL